MNKIKVLKRDGSTEEFDSKKIEKISIAAGLTNEDASLVTNEVIKEVEAVAKDHEISSVHIRDIMFEKLERVNKYAAGLYKWYETTKQKSS